MIKRLLISSILGAVSVAAQLPVFDLIGFDADRVELAESELLTLEENISPVAPAQELELDVEDVIGAVAAGVQAFGLSAILHPLFVGAYAEEWEAELLRFTDEPEWDFEALNIQDNSYIIAPHINLIMGDSELLQTRLLDAVDNGANIIIIPYRIGYELQPVRDMIDWASEYFEKVLIGFSANRPWPSPSDLRETLNILLDGTDGIITAWVSSIDIAGVFAPHQEDTSRFDTWVYMTRWVGNEAKSRNVPVIGFRKIDVHGTWDQPSRPGGYSGGVFDYTPEGLSAYIYAHIHPFDSGMLIPSRQRIEDRKNHQFHDKPSIIGPFYYRGENPGPNHMIANQFRRLVLIYRSMGYNVVEKWLR